MNLTVYRGASPVEIIKVDDRSQHSKRVNGEDVLNIQVQAQTPLNIQLGDTITYNDEIYKINTTPKVKKDSSSSFDYRIVFEHEMYDMGKVLLLDDNRSEFFLIGNASFFVDLFVSNMDRSYSGQWTKGAIASTIEKNLQFSNETVLEALQKVVQAFGLYLDVSSKVITLTSVPGTDTGLTFKYGKGKGLYSLERNVVSSKNLITRLYVYGSERNIPSNYRNFSKRLMTANAGSNYLDKNIATYGQLEAAKIFDDIYPRYKGTISHLTDTLTFRDTSMDFDVNSYLVGGVPAKVHFNTGNLAGYEFEITEYNHTTKSFTLKQFEDSNGDLLPQASYGFAVSDEYVILDITMPASYVTAAESELQAEAQKYLDENSSPRVKYSLDPDKVYLEQNDIQLYPGYSVTVFDSDLSINKLVTIQKVTTSLDNPYDVKVELSDVLEVQLISQAIAIGVENRVILAGLRTYNKKLDLQAYQRKQELQDTIYDPDGYFNTANIRPLSIETGMLSVGFDSGDFLLENVMDANPGSDTTKFNSTEGRLIHNKFAQTWTILANNVTGLTAGQVYYIYAHVDASNLVAITNKIEIDVAQRSLDDGSHYNFLVGILHSAIDGVRQISLTYGSTTINGGFITTGKIKNSSGSIYFDLDAGVVNAGNSGINGAAGASQIRFWAGSTFANRATAPFRVNDAGEFTATAGSIGGFSISNTTLTGGKLRTADETVLENQSVVIDGSDNSIKFYPSDSLVPGFQLSQTVYGSEIAMTNGRFSMSNTAGSTLVVDADHLSMDGGNTNQQMARFVSNFDGSDGGTALEGSIITSYSVANVNPFVGVAGAASSGNKATFLIGVQGIGTGSSTAVSGKLIGVEGTAFTNNAGQTGYGLYGKASGAGTNIALYTDGNVQLENLPAASLETDVVYLDKDGNLAVGPAGAGGTVTSIGLAFGALFSVTGSPVTTSGTITASLTTQGQNTVFAGPPTGVSGTPSFRGLDASDIPTITASKISDFASAVGSSETSHSNVLVDEDFATAGLMKSNGSGGYSIVTDSSASWNSHIGTTGNPHGTAFTELQEGPGTFIGEGGNLLRANSGATALEFIDPSLISVLKAATWTTARTLTIGSTGKSVNGSGNVSWSLSEIGAQATNSILTELIGLAGAGSGYVKFDDIGDTFYIEPESFLSSGSVFGGDVSGTYNAIVVANDSHTHTVSTISDFAAGVSGNSSVSANTTHRGSNGSDHSYIDQAVTSTSSPTFDNVRFNGTLGHGHGVQFWSSAGYSIYMDKVVNEPYGVTELSATGDYQMYFRMTGAGRGFTFFNLDDSTQAAAQITGDGFIHARQGFKTPSNSATQLLASNGSEVSTASFQPAGSYNTIIGTDGDINTSGATIIDNLYMTDGVITSHGTRTLSASDIGAITSMSFDGLTSKTSGTGDYSTTGHLISGRGSGGAALTINDGQGNANLTFNHADGIAEQAGNCARIVSNPDATSGAFLGFELKSNGTAGAVTTIEYMNLTESTLSLNNGLNLIVGGTGDFSGEVTAASFTGNLSGNATTSSSCSGNAASATKVYVNEYSGTTNMRILGSHNGIDSVGNVYSTPECYIEMDTNKIHATTFVGALSGNASTATWADTVDVNTSASTSVYQVVWHSGDTLYSCTNSKLYVQPSTGDLFCAGKITSTSSIIGGITVGNALHRDGLLEINRKGTTGWSGLQIKFSSTALWSVMGDQDNVGVYDDVNSHWIWQHYENNRTDFMSNSDTVRFSVTNTGASVSGALTVSGNITAYSDTRLKNVEGSLSPQEALRIHNSINPIQYTWKDNGAGYEAGKKFGFSAQEVMKAFPMAANYDSDKDIYSINVVPLVALNASAIKGVDEKVRSLEIEIEDLQREIQTLKGI